MGNVPRVRLEKKAPQTLANESIPPQAPSEAPATAEIIPLNRQHELGDCSPIQADSLAVKPEPDHSETPNEGLIPFLLQVCQFLLDLAGVTYIRVPNLVQDTPKRMLWMGLKSEEFRRWMRYLSCRPTEKEITDTIRFLDAKVSQEYSPEPVYNRFAQYDGKTYLDLANERGEVIETDGKNWRVLDDSPIPFVTSGLPLPTPKAGGSIQYLRSIINLKRVDFCLAIAWLLNILHGKGPYPILFLRGSSSSGKGVVAEVLRSIIDPVHIPIINPPHTPAMLRKSADLSAILAINQPGAISEALANEICSITEGYSKSRFVPVLGKGAVNDHPVIIKSITPLSRHVRLLNRCIFLYVSPLAEKKVKPPSQLIKQFQGAHPLILGALLDLMVSVLAKKPVTPEVNHPRMADYASYLQVVEEKLALPVGSSYERLRYNNMVETKAAAECSRVAEVLMSGTPLRNRFYRGATDKNGVWTGTMKDLLEIIRDSSKDKSGFPSNHIAMAFEMQNQKENLELFGIHWERAGRGRHGRIIRLWEDQNINELLEEGTSNKQ